MFVDKAGEGCSGEKAQHKQSPGGINCISLLPGYNQSINHRERMRVSFRVPLLKCGLIPGNPTNKVVGNIYMVFKFIDFGTNCLIANLASAICLPK